jgi:hypothetical protein
MATKTKALRTETIMGQAAVQAILAAGGIPALLLRLALANGTIKIGGVNIPAKAVRAGARKVGAPPAGGASLAEDIQSARSLMRLVGLKSAELEALLNIGDDVAATIDRIHTIGQRVEAPVAVLKTGGREYNLAVGIRRTK